jgi:hypothetical protein
LPIRPKSIGHGKEGANEPRSRSVMDLIFGRWRSQILSAGTELGVFDHLGKRTARTAETLAVELGADPTLLYRLLRAQAAIGLLEEDGARGFALTALEPQRNREDCAGRVMVANRTREMRPSGMTRGAYGDVDYGKG